MPNNPSTIKRMRSDARKHRQNQAVLSELQTRYRKLVSAAKTNKDAAKEEARILVSKLDKAVSYGVIPHRRADRKKGRIAKLLNKK